MTVTRPAAAMRLAAATESSRDALSTTMIGHPVVSSRRVSVPVSSAERSRVAMTKEVRGMVDMTGATTPKGNGETGFHPRPEGYQSPMRSLTRVLITGGAGF